MPGSQRNGISYNHQSNLHKRQAKHSDTNKAHINQYRWRDTDSLQKKKIMFWANQENLLPVFIYLFLISVDLLQTQRKKIHKNEITTDKTSFQFNPFANLFFLKCKYVSWFFRFAIAWQRRLWYRLVLLVCNKKNADCIRCSFFDIQYLWNMQKWKRKKNVSCQYQRKYFFLFFRFISVWKGWRGTFFFWNTDYSYRLIFRRFKSISFIIHSSSKFSIYLLHK